MDMTAPASQPYWYRVCIATNVATDAPATAMTPGSHRLFRADGTRTRAARAMPTTTVGTTTSTGSRR